MITIWLGYSIMSPLKKLHFLDLVCSERVLTIQTWLSYRKRSLLKKGNFLYLTCAIYVLTVKIKVFLSNLLPSKSRIILT